MDDMTAFERQLSTELQDLMGPVRPVDDLAIFDATAAAGRSKNWGFTMLSGMKLATAGAFLALFGGFVLAALLASPQGDDVGPAAATERPSPTAAEAVLSGMITAELEPGVLQVTNDGLRDLSFTDPVVWDIVAGEDGGIWLLMRENGGFFRLGTAGDHPWAWTGRTWDWQESPISFDVAPDGTPWAVLAVGESGPTDTEPPWEREPPWAIASYDGEAWTQHQPVPDVRARLEVTPDGRVWATWLDDAAASRSSNPGYLADDGWHTIAGLPGSLGPYVSDAGDLWATDDHAGRGWAGMLHRHVDGAWAATDRRVVGAAAGADGTLWALDDGADEFSRFDGDVWQDWSFEDFGLQPWRMGPQLPYDVGPGGSLWAGWWVAGEGDDPWACDGVRRFDGVTWVRYLDGLCVEAMDIAADGSVWVLAWPQDQVGLYGEVDTDSSTYPIHVITSDAIAGSE